MQLTTLLEILDESDGTYQSSTVKDLLQKCELLQQEEQEIDDTMSPAEKEMIFYTGTVVSSLT